MCHYCSVFSLVDKIKMYIHLNNPLKKDLFCCRNLIYFTFKNQLNVENVLKPLQTSGCGYFELWHWVFFCWVSKYSPHSCIRSAASSEVVFFDAQVRGQRSMASTAALCVRVTEQRGYWAAAVTFDRIANQQTVKYCSVLLTITSSIRFLIIHQ